jgi:hypothetical protein
VAPLKMGGFMLETLIEERGMTVYKSTVSTWQVKEAS